MKWYDPDEDSYTFYDLIVEVNIKNKIVVDLGTSTGILSESLEGNLVIGIELNKNALVEQKNKRKGSNLVRGNLLQSINQREIDIVVFNPPYVLDSKDPIIGGGVLGREVIDQFIKEVEVDLFYLLIIKANRPKEVLERVEQRGYIGEIVRERKILGETIMIIKGSRVVVGSGGV